MEQRLNAQLKQQQQLTQEQRHSLRLLQMPTVELQAEIDQVIDDNPLLEREESPVMEVEAPYEEMEPPAEASCSLDEEPSSETEMPLEAMYDDWRIPSAEASPIEQIAIETDFREELREELRCLNHTPREIFFASCLIEELDDRGFLTSSLSTIAQEYEHIALEAGCTDATPEDWTQALQHIQFLDPIGIGTSGPVEAMILQAQRLVVENKISQHSADLISHILRKNLLDLARQNRLSLLKKSGANESELLDALDILEKLTPYPVKNSQKEAQYVQPDIVIKKIEHRLTAILPSSPSQSVRLCSQHNIDKLSKTIGQTLVARYTNDARAFIRGLHARQETLQKIADILVREQKPFFEQGTKALKPWTIGELADEVGLALSTVSRAISGKFILCDNGMIELRSLFSSSSFNSRSNDGESSEICGSAQVQAYIVSLIEQEDPLSPLTDDALKTCLEKRKIVIARRTVAKYREAAGIPSARVRRRH